MTFYIAGAHRVPIEKENMQRNECVNAAVIEVLLSILANMIIKMRHFDEIIRLIIYIYLYI